MKDKRFLIKHISKCGLALILSLFFALCFNATFAQEFRIDSFLIERETFAKDSSGDISVIKKVFVTASYSTDDPNRSNEYEGYVIKAEYWLFWNNKLDSLQISVQNPLDKNNFTIYTRHIQNKIKAVVLEFSEILDASPQHGSRERIFRIINLDTKEYLFSTTEGELQMMPNGGAHGDYRHDIDTYIQEYSLTFDSNDNITLTHTKSVIQRGMGKSEEKKTMPPRIFILTYKDGRTFYLRKYD
jgi:hypothetical protein